jgi:hypothetical protein
MKILHSSPLLFIKTFIVILIVPIILLVIFNLIIDPYDIFRFMKVHNVNEIKPCVTTNLRMAKAHIVHIMQPSAVIFGTSRTELGIDPEHHGFKNLGYEAYNMSMAGSGLHEILRSLQHAYYASNKKLKLAVIGLDFLMFNMNREKIVFGTEVFGYDESRLMLSPQHSHIKSILFDLDNILFFQGLLASIQTIKQQDSLELYLPNGMRHPEKNMLAVKMPSVGHRKEFVLNEEYYMQKIWTPAPEQRYCAYCLDSNKSTFDTFRKILSFARENNIELRLFISPTHSRKLIALKESGLWPTLEEWKTELVIAIEDDIAQHPQANPPSLWDFMTFNSITTERVPEMTDIKAEMWGYWEVSHYKLSVGNLVLDRVLDHTSVNRQMPNDFGIKLSSQNIIDVLNKMRSASFEYERLFPQDVAEIRAMAQEIFPKRDGTAAYKLYYQATQARDKGNEALAIRLSKDAAKLQIAEEHECNIRKLPYREQALAHLIHESIAGIKIEKQLPSWADYQTRANEKVLARDFEGAIKDFTKAIEIGPQNSALHYLRGTTLLKLDKFQDAIDDFNEILMLEPENATVQELLRQAKVALDSNSMKKN